MPDPVLTPEASTPAAPSSAAPAPALAPVPETAAMAANRKSWLDRSIGITTEEADKFTKQHLEGQQALTAPPSPLGAPEPAPAPENAPAPAPEPKNEPPKRRQPKARAQDRPVLDEDVIARVAGKAAAEALNARPKNEPEPEPKNEPELPRAVQREHRNLVALEEMDPSKKGVAAKFLNAYQQDQEDKVARTKEYIRTWQKDNPGETYDGESKDHDQFFTALEAEPLPDIGVDENDLEDAREFRIRKEAFAEAQKAMSKEKTELERRVRGVEAKEALRKTSTDASTHVLELLQVPDVAQADELVRPIYEDAAARASNFASATYALMNGLIAEDKDNGVHMQVRKVSEDMRRKLAAVPPEESEDNEGRRYIDPAQYDRLSRANKAQHWTIGVEDVVEFANSIIAGQAKAHAEAEEKKMENYAKSKGFEIKKPAAKPAAAPAVATRTNPAQPQRVNAPSLSSGVKTPVSVHTGTSIPQNIRDSLVSRI